MTQRTCQLSSIFTSLRSTALAVFSFDLPALLDTYNSASRSSTKRLPHPNIARHLISSSSESLPLSVASSVL